MHHHNKEKFEEICVLIKNVDTNDDAIMQTLKLRTIGEKFRSAIKDEKLLRWVSINYAIWSFIYVSWF